MTSFVTWDYSVLPKRELQRSRQIDRITAMARGGGRRDSSAREEGEPPRGEQKEKPRRPQQLEMKLRPPPGA